MGAGLKDGPRIEWAGPKQEEFEGRGNLENWEVLEKWEHPEQGTTSGNFKGVPVEEIWFGERSRKRERN